MYAEKLGLDTTPPPYCPVVWAHGWGRTGADLYNVADALSTRYAHYLLDLPGFGQSPRPEQPWDTAQYADAVAEWINQQGIGPVIWVGHSFGCRVGMRLAAAYPDLVKGMVLVAAAGLKRHRQGTEKWRYAYRTRSYKVLKAVTPASRRDALRAKYSSADYLNAGEMRDIFLKTIAEDQTLSVVDVACPVRLLCGSLDTETPPEISQRLAGLMQNARMTQLETMNHWDVLTRGAPMITKAVVDLQEGRS